MLGLVAIVSSLAADLFSAGPRGLQAAQLLVLEAGIALAVAGTLLKNTKPDRTIDASRAVIAASAWLAGFPNLGWFGGGLAVSYLAFFAGPMFLNSTMRMEYFVGYLPDRSPIGNDLLVVTDLIRAWFSSGQSPYVEQFYPPFVYVSFAPLVLLEHADAYRLITLVTLACSAVCMLLAWLLAGRRKEGLMMLFLVTGLLSYGLQFELERGQFNIIAMALVLASIYVFHRLPRWRILAYALFTIAVQLKVYPAIFALMLIEDWRDWKGSVKRLGGLAAVNAAMLLVAGPRLFVDFLGSVTQQMLSPTMNFWNGNHSINAFVFGLTTYGYGVIPQAARAGWVQAAPWIKAVLLAALAACFVMVIIRRGARTRGFNPFLLLACTMAALMVPISNDYKLALLAAPLALALAAVPEAGSLARRAVTAALLLLTGAAYGALLIPFKYKPFYLGNSFPLLLVILLSVTALSLFTESAGENTPGTSAASSRTR